MFAPSPRGTARDRVGSAATHMAEPSTLFRYQIELSDVHRGIYDTLSLRVACHPSEEAVRLVARVLSYALLWEEGLEFGRGLSTAEDPALLKRGHGGEILHWVDVGCPSADRMHRASKHAEKVTVVCFRGHEPLMREAQKRRIHQSDAIRVVEIPAQMIQQLATLTDRAQEWTVVRTDHDLQVIAGDVVVEGTIREGTLDGARAWTAP